MNFDFMFSPTILLTLAGGIIMLLFCLFFFLIDFKLTRPIVFMCGVVFIGVGVLGHITFIEILEHCKELATSGNVSRDVLSRLERYHLIFTYILPFISGAIGTNVISDALLKHQTYERSFSFIQFVRDCAEVFLVLIGLVLGVFFIFFFGVSILVAFTRNLVFLYFPRIQRWIYLKVLKISMLMKNVFRSKPKRK